LRARQRGCERKQTGAKQDRSGSISPIVRIIHRFASPGSGHGTATVSVRTGSSPPSIHAANSTAPAPINPKAAKTETRREGAVGFVDRVRLRPDCDMLRVP
jgi:hypothetical protein